MPNGSDKNWWRLCYAIDGFRRKHGSWPTRVRLEEVSLADMRDHVLPRESLDRIGLRLELVAEQGAYFIAEDEAGRSYTYGDGLESDDPTGSVGRWLGLSANGEINRTSWTDVAAAFEHHIAHYAAHGGGESALVGLRAEGSVQLQYAGRVVLELLQNALDRAAHEVRVTFVDGRLTVANDGEPFSVDDEFDYSAPKVGTQRSDFNALCALHTSNKSADRQFGNKGIGFRSVFGVSNAVEVWCRLDQGGWWGLRLRAALVPCTDWPDTPLPALDQRVRALGAQARPSFHLPIPLRSANPPGDDLESMETAVLVTIEDDAHRTQIAHELADLKRTRMHFVGLRRQGLRVLLDDAPLDPASGWRVYSETRSELRAAAHAAAHPIDHPCVAIAWPQEGCGPDTRGRFFNHLPMRMASGLPIDVHADFQVKADRESMALETDHAVGAYNHALVTAAASLHARTLRAACAGPTLPREDLWRLAQVPESVPEAWTRALQDALLPAGDWSGWIDMARAFFAKPRALEAYREFWHATESWLWYTLKCGPWTRTWKDAARQLCDRLAKDQLQLIPIDAVGGLDAVRLPSRQGRGERAEQRVFFQPEQRAEQRAELPSMPAPLLELGRAVTTFDLGAWVEPAVVATFEATEVLRDLRQVPSDPARPLQGEALSDNDQRDLLRFARALLELTDRGAPHFAWRASSDVDAWRQMGRALATLHLPTTEGAWEPARQLSADRVDLKRLTQESGEPVLDAELLRWLGVAPAGALPLLEDGDAGLQPARSQAPALQPAGPDNVARLLRPRLAAGVTIEAVRRTLRELPPDSEHADVRAILGAHRWFNPTVLRSDASLAPIDRRVAPHEILLELKDPRGRLLPVPGDPDAVPVLAELGAMTHIGDERSVARVEPLLRFLQDRYPDPTALPTPLDQRLTQLVSALLDALPGTDDPFDAPLLIESDGRLRWWRRGEEAWLCAQDRAELRRFFPGLPLVVGPGSSRLGLPTVKLEREVKHASDPVGNDALARALSRRLQGLLGVLCAVAEQQRQATVDPGRVRRLWFEGGTPLMQVHDAWLELRVIGPAVEAQRWRQDAFEDVFLSEEPGGRLRILFDTRRTQGPPLANFAEALAMMLTNNPVLAPAFAEVLAAAEAGHLEQLLERRHLCDQADAWQRELTPLTDDERRRLVDALTPFCRDAEAALFAGVLTPSDLRDELDLDTEAALERALQQAVADRRLQPFIPRPTITAEHRERWHAWRVLWGRRLQAYAEALGDGADPTDVQSLQRRAERSLGRLDFTPEAVASEWLATLDLTLEAAELTPALAAFVPRFAVVRAAPIALSSSGWRAAAGSLGTAASGPEKRLTPAAIQADQLTRSLYGDEAELALLDWAVRTTAPLLVNDDAQQVLLSAFSPTSTTRAIVERALASGDLDEALHIARHWSGAGFDLIGLESGDLGLEVVRYECKGLAVAAERVRVHLSRNELAVARRVRSLGPGRWELAGVQPDGCCVLLTPLIEELLTDAPPLLEPLTARGLEPDGLRLVIGRA